MIMSSTADGAVVGSYQKHNPSGGGLSDTFTCDKENNRISVPLPNVTSPVYKEGFVCPFYKIT